MSTLYSSLVRILTVPNGFTLLRLLMLPVFLWMLLTNENRAGAALLLGVLGMTDWVDGWLARALHQRSDFGAIFDPVVDRLLFIVGAVGVWLDGGVAQWFLALILVRELVVGATLTIATVFGMEPFAVSTLGKRYTFLLMTSVPLLLLGASSHPTASGATVLGWVLGIPGLALSYVTAIAYIPEIRLHLRKGRAARRLR
jgi:cardiolipin synthase